MVHDRDFAQGAPLQRSGVGRALFCGLAQGGIAGVTLGGKATTRRVTEAVVAAIEGG